MSKQVKKVLQPKKSSSKTALRKALPSNTLNKRKSSSYSWAVTASTTSKVKKFSPVNETQKSKRDRQKLDKLNVGNNSKNIKKPIGKQRALKKDAADKTLKEMVAALKKQIVLMNKKLKLAEEKIDKPGSKNPLTKKSHQKSENKCVAKPKSQVKPVAGKNKSRVKSASALEESRTKSVDGKKKQNTGGNKSHVVKPVLTKSHVKTLSKKSLVKNAVGKKSEEPSKTNGPLPVDQKTKKGDRKGSKTATKKCRPDKRVKPVDTTAGGKTLKPKSTAAKKVEAADEDIFCVWI